MTLGVGAVHLPFAGLSGGAVLLGYERWCGHEYGPHDHAGGGTRECAVTSYVSFFPGDPGWHALRGVVDGLLCGCFWPFGQLAD